MITSFGSSMHIVNTWQPLYKAQFISSAKENHSGGISKAWAPHKCKLFACLILQNRVFTLGRLATRGWPDSPMWNPCHQTWETMQSLLVGCRHTKRMWSLVTTWLPLPTNTSVLGMAAKHTIDETAGKHIITTSSALQKNNQEPNSACYMRDFERKKSVSVPI